MPQKTKFSGKGRNGILGRIQRDGNNADLAFAVGNSHATDDEFSVLMEKRIESFDRTAIFHDNAHNSDPCFHCDYLQTKNRTNSPVR